MIWIIALCSAVFYAAIAEYVLHRFVLHRKRWLLSSWFTDHSVEHHGKGRNDTSISVNPLTATLVASPMMLWCFILGAPWALMVVGIAFLYAGAWTMVHRAHHDLGCSWIKSLPWYLDLRVHHFNHHDQPNRNFGAMFPWTDRLFRTRVKP